LHTGADLITDKQKDRLAALFAVDAHVEVEATWGIYQRMIAAYREPDRTQGRQLIEELIASVTSGVPTALTEIRRLGRTLKQRATDVLAYFEWSGTSHGPTEAICECLPGWSGTGWSDPGRCQRPVQAEPCPAGLVGDRDRSRQSSNPPPDIFMRGHQPRLEHLTRGVSPVEWWALGRGVSLR